MSFAKAATVHSAALALTILVYGLKIYDAIALISKTAFFIFLSKDSFTFEYKTLFCLLYIITNLLHLLGNIISVVLFHGPVSPTFFSLNKPPS
jgi:DNA integrity scanning protein DisA with diadenylate cyclase activity